MSRIVEVSELDLLTERIPSAEVCKIYHISRRTLRRRLAENPDIRPIRAGRDMLFTNADLHAFDEALRCRSTSSHPGSAKSAAPEKPAPIRSSATKSTDGNLRSLRRQETHRLTQRLLRELRRG